MCLQDSGEICIVVAKSFQNRHIGRRAVGEILKLAREKNMSEVFAEIYSFNTQSQKMFESIGFTQVETGKYIMKL